MDHGEERSADGDAPDGDPAPRDEQPAAPTPTFPPLPPIAFGHVPPPQQPQAIPPGAPPPLGYPPPGSPPTPGYLPPPPGYPPPPPGYPWPPPGYQPSPPGYAPPPPGYPPPPPGYPWPPPGYQPSPPGYPWRPGYPPPPPSWGAPYAPPQVGFGRFRPQSVGEIFDAAFSLYRRNFLLLVLISAVVQIPSLITGLVSNAIIRSTLGTATAITGDQPLTTAQADQIYGDAAVGVLIALALGLLTVLVIGPIGVAATSRAVSDRYLDRPATVWTSFRAALRRIRALLGMSIVTAMMVALPAGAAIVAAGIIFPPLLILVIPAIIVYAIVLIVMFAMAPQAVVLEGCGPLAALRRSYALTRGALWRVLGYLALLWLLSIVFSLIFAVIGAAFTSGLDTATAETIRTIFDSIIAVFIGPVTYATLTLLYYDIRIRREAFDVEMLAQSL